MEVELWGMIGLRLWCAKVAVRAMLAAHESARRDGTEFTEDASLFFHYAQEPVRILAGMDHNIKITVPTDTVTAEAIYADMIGRRS